MIKLESGDASEALGFYRAALALRPESPGVLLNLASALSKLDRHDDAIAVLERAIHIKPDYASAYNNLGGNSSAKGHRTKRSVLFGRPLRSIRQTRLAHYNLGTTLV